ncbi:hypothetical protein DFH29DRAFT_985224 [Suillus ampliporus]|nr:hypothetical protein DFH29DRAFT_985224 [Suillus ampliporus]
MAPDSVVGIEVSFSADVRDETSSEKLAMFTYCPLPRIPFADLKNLLSDLMLELSGVKPCSDGKYQLSLCSVCHKKLVKGKRPALSLANHTFLGDVPDKLKDLMVIKEAMIAHCRVKCWIIQLKEENQNLQLSTNQHGMKGHIIIYPQCPEGIAAILPPTVDDIVTPICVIFVGSNPLSQAWLQEKAKPLIARREKVCATLVWLKKHNRLYKDITIDHTILDSMEDKTLMPFHMKWSN